jgi:hypothetical protein
MPALAGVAANRGADAAAVAPMAMPFRKSRRVMGRSMPGQGYRSGEPLASPWILYIMTVTVYIYR